MIIDSVIFDLDGTLLDSMHCWENVDRNFLLENGIEPPPGISDIVKKMTVEESALYFKSEFGLNQSCTEIIDRIEEMVKRAYFTSLPLKKGALETVRVLRDMNIKMCVATATYQSLVYAALKRLGIYEYFDFVITCSDVGVGKDKPDIFIEAARRLGSEIQNTVVIEDSLHCIESASGAGFPTIGVYDPVSEADWESICEKSWKNIRELTEITDIIKG